MYFGQQKSTELKFWKGVFVLYDSWKFVLYLYWTLLLLRKFLDYEKIDVRIQILIRHKLKPHHKYIVVTISVQKSIYKWPLNEQHLVKQWLAEKKQITSEALWIVPEHIERLRITAEHHVAEQSIMGQHKAPQITCLFKWIEPGWFP